MYTVLHQKPIFSLFPYVWLLVWFCNWKLIYFTNFLLADCPPYFQGNTSVPCWYLGNKCYCFSSFRVGCIIAIRLKRNGSSPSYINLKFWITQLPTWMRCDEYCKGGNMTLLSLETEAEDMLINSHVQANPGMCNNILNYILF